MIRKMRKTRYRGGRLILSPEELESNWDLNLKWEAAEFHRPASSLFSLVWIY
jgi:hypothetical protein